MRRNHAMLLVFLLVAGCASPAPAGSQRASSVSPGSSGPTGAATPVATPAVPPPAASTTPRCPNPNDGGSCLGALKAGTYRTTVFELPITYTVPDGWQNLEDLPGNFLLIPPGKNVGGADTGTTDYVSVGSRGPRQP